MALTSGTRLGPYEIQSPLGAGGMGEVYRALDTRLDRSVAIKILPQHLSSSPDLKQRFDREARAISSLNHPRICTLHDTGQQGGIDYLVMEFLEGQSLAERLRKGPLPLKECLKIGIEVCDALEAAHRAGIIHRDLKPGNIMLTKNGAKLMDFGLAKAAMTNLAPASAPLLSAARTMTEATPLSPLTSAGMIVGTIQYMAPEQIEGKEADARSDLFALGAVLYEMASGKRPFEGKSQLSLATAILEKDPEPLRALKPVTPPAFERVVTTCLAKNPDDRFQSAHDVRLELGWIAKELPELTVSGAAARPSRTSRPFLPWTITAAAIVLAVVALLFAGREVPAPRYTNISHREGTLTGARFSHDGQTIVYSGQWEDDPTQISVARVGSPESRPLGIPSAEVEAISSDDELGVFLGCDLIFYLTCGGTLATVNLAGGSPRTLTENVAQADWHPDGKRFVISAKSPEGPRLEFPPGHVIYQQAAGWFGHPRFSPDGSMIAFENHPIDGNDDGEVDLIDMDGKRSVLFPESNSVEGLAWTPDGKELWFAAATRNSGWADTIYAIKPGGKLRTVLTSPSIRLFDISKDGKVLLSRETWRRQLRGLFAGDKAEHAYSWSDETQATAISSDGRFISFYEGGDVYGLAKDFQAYYRATDGSPAIRLGVGTLAMAPNAKWVVLASNHRDPRLPLQIQSLGAGQSRDLPTPGLVAFDRIRWCADGQQIVYEAQTEQGGWNVYRQMIAGGSPQLLAANSKNSYPTLSTDGKIAALRQRGQGIALYPTDGGKPFPLKGASNNEYPVLFPTGNKSLLVLEPTANEQILTLIDLASGRRQPWKRFPSEAHSDDQLFVATPDLKYYAYPLPRDSSVLYVVEDLH